MALPPLASVEEFDAWPGVTVGANTEAAEAVLSYVSARIRSLAGGKTWVDTSGPEPVLADVPDVIPGIVVSVAARVWANPAASAAMTTGPYSSAWAEIMQGVRFTPEERAAIAQEAATPGSPAGLSVLSTTRGPVETGWLSCGPLWPEEVTIPWQ